LFSIIEIRAYLLLRLIKPDLIPTAAVSLFSNVPSLIAAAVFQRPWDSGLSPSCPSGPLLCPGSRQLKLAMGRLELTDNTLQHDCLRSGQLAAFSVSMSADS
jgi:hypothetical protein